MPRGGRRKARDWRLEDRRIYHRGRGGHREIKWAVGSGRGAVYNLQKYTAGKASSGTRAI
jgi:hypothetical protein